MSDPRGRRGAVLATGRAVLALARDAEVTFLAAAIAYYGLVSVVPALVLALGVAAWIGGPTLVEAVLASSAAVLTESARGVLGEALLDGTSRGGVTVLGLAVLGWGALKAFRGLDRAFSRVYGTSAELGFAEGVRNGTVGLLAVGGALVLMVALGAAFAALSLPVAGWLLGLVGLLVGLYAAFLPLYVVFPGRPVGPREASPGAALAAGGWVALQTAFQLYASLTGAADLYGVLGGVLLLVTWFYAAAVLVLLGAVLNAVLAGGGPVGDRQAEERREPRRG